MSLLIQPARQEDFSPAGSRCLRETFCSTASARLRKSRSMPFSRTTTAPIPLSREINLGPFVADIANREGVTEIQTRGFGSMRKKLGSFCKHYPVRVIYPAAAVKWVVWVDPQTGETVARNRSPKKTAAYGIFRELYSVLDLLWPAGFSVTIALLECEEYRLLNGRGPAHKKGAQRLELIPSAMLGEIVLHTPRDLLAVFAGRPARALHQRRPAKIRSPERSKHLLPHPGAAAAGAIEQVGKQGALSPLSNQSLTPLHSAAGAV